MKKIIGFDYTHRPDERINLLPPLMKKHNFYAGPSILSQYTIKNTADAVMNFADMGLSILEISHRSEQFKAVLDESRALVKELLDVPDGYSVLWLGSGASMQFAMVPMNFLNRKAAYLDTGVWASKAIKEARLFGEVDVVASSADRNYNYIPRNYTVPADSDYFHYTTNNTIYGTEIRKDPDVGNVPLVADMSSDIFTRPVDVSKYNLIYAGAQKNIAPSGIALVIVKEEALGNVDRVMPSILNYRNHVDNGSMFNTPPVLPIYAALQTLKYYKELGGIPVLEKRNLEKAELLYEALDSSRMFLPTVPGHEDRSIMNVCFVMKPEYADLEETFIDFAAERGIVGIRGHRYVNGFRASIYNAMPLESVRVLVEAMKDFQEKY